MPFAGAAKQLAAVFGFGFSNGFAFDTINQGPASFQYSDKTLFANAITNGRNSSEYVNKLITFTGLAFKIPSDAKTILAFNKNFINFVPDTAWQFDDKTVKIPVKGWWQGAYKKFGKGRFVAFGEAAMFSAQLGGPQKSKMGMNADIAKDNYKLLLNIIHWLDRKLN